jgi:hypothetical protein
LFTWGDGAYGRLGHGNMDSCFEPRVVASLQQLTVSTVSCGAYHTAAICFGTQQRGDPEASTHLSRPLANGGGGGSGVLYTWGCAFDVQSSIGGGGSSNEGCLGLPMLQRHEGVVKPHPVELPDVVHVACGLNFTVAVDVEGAVYQMGSMLRVGEVPGCPWEGASVPTRVKGELVEMHVTHASAGTSHVIVTARSLRHTNDGNEPPLLTLTWGANDKGQLARSIQVPEQHRAGANTRLGQMLEQMLCLTPDHVAGIEGMRVSSVVASANSTAVVTVVSKQQTHASAASSDWVTRRSSGPPSPNSTKAASYDVAMKSLRSVRTSTSDPGKLPVKDRDDARPPTNVPHARPAPTHAQSAGMAVLASTMPGSTWVNPLLASTSTDAMRGDAPRIMHVRGAMGAHVPGGMPSLSLPVPEIEPPPRHVQNVPVPMPMPLPPPLLPEFERVRLDGRPSSSRSSVQSSRAQEAPPPAVEYSSAADMWHRLKRGGPARVINGLPAPPKAGPLLLWFICYISLFSVS